MGKLMAMWFITVQSGKSKIRDEIFAYPNSEHIFVILQSVLGIFNEKEKQRKKKESIIAIIG